VVNHLAFLPGTFAAREPLQAVLEEASGGRIHYMANRVGGLKEDVPAGWTDRVRRAVDGLRPTCRPSSTSRRAAAC
jgi:NADH-quinone oxidoreductase subunit D